MSDAKHNILNRIRRVNSERGGDLAPEERLKAANARLSQHPKGIIPKRAQLPHRECVALFKTMAEKVHARVEHVSGYEQVPQAIAAYLRAHNLPSELVMGEDHRFDLMLSDDAPFTVHRGTTQGKDLIGLSHAECGIAESGSLMLLSGRDNPTRINFLSDHHIVLLDIHQIFGDMESAWDHVRQLHTHKQMPRMVNFITGPSRSADIEQKLLLGAHGPRAVFILMIDNQT